MNTISLPLVDEQNPPIGLGERGGVSPSGSEFPGFANVREGAGEAEGVGFDRRDFLRVMGASLALAGVGLSGCRRPDFQILPYTRPPEDQVPGLPTFYATCQPRVGGAIPLLVENDEGRPTKIEGNPRHPCSQGATDAWAQASLLDLYHPDRSRSVLRNRLRSTWEVFEAAVTWPETVTKKNGEDVEVVRLLGDGLRVLTRDVPSPIMRSLRKRLAEKFPNARWHTWQPFGLDNARAGLEIALGERANVTVDYAGADIVIALDCDFLGHDGGIRETKGFSARRRIAHDPDKHDHHPDLSRLYVIEPTWSVTGTMADNRLRLPASQIFDILAVVARSLFNKPDQFNKELRDVLEGVYTKIVGLSGVLAKDHPQRARLDAWIRELQGELDPGGRRVVIVVGPRQPAITHALAAAINDFVGATKPVKRGDATLPPLVTYRKLADEPARPLRELVDDLRTDKVETLLILDGNPAFDGPADFALQTAIPRAKTSVHVGLHANETASVCTWHLPGTHFLEQWGDAEAADGSYCIVQPLISPLVDGARSPDEVLARLLKVEKSAPIDLLKASFAERTGGSDESAFKKALQLGFVPGSERKPDDLPLNLERIGDALKAFSPPPQPGGDRIELTFLPDYRLLDGQYASNAWLQELPDPITKVTWDNTALVSPATARKFSVTTGDTLTIDAGEGRGVTLPVFVLPGQADNSIGIRLGGGRTRAGRVGSLLQMDPSTGIVRPSDADGGGVNAYPLRSSAHLDAVVFPADRLSKGSEGYTLAMTQEHQPITTQHGRDIVRITTASEFGKHTHEAHEHPQANLSYTNPLDDAQGWGMVVDLHLCNGCSACMIACQAENNVPGVGTGEVVRGRDMHWIRLDRYFLTGSRLGYTDGDDKRADDVPGEVGMVSQPVMCVHCEAAPCELVCPVNAAVHSPEGLNLQVYNRCIGTRYCSNNCPYKARRFNWFDYNQRPLDALRAGPLTDKGMPELLKMSKNPDVTVRMRGVMEKCTYCVQRIERAKIGVKLAAMQRLAPGETLTADLRVPDGVITPACAQACPADAITFGNVKDPASRVARMKRDNPRNYLLLGELNTFPRTSYLARVRNPNPALLEVEKGAGK